MRHHHMHPRGHWGKKIALFAVIGVAAAIGFTFVTMSLWNWLLPELFGLKLITFWQTLGLLVLSWLFFGRFRGLGLGRHHHMKHRLAERWMRMSPEEREKFHEEMHEHRGGRGRGRRGEPPAEGNAG